MEFLCGDEGPDGVTAQLASLKMNQSQINKLMEFLSGSSQGSEHMEDTICLNSIKIMENEWIIDSDATDHITPHGHLLQNLVRLKVPYSVILSNGCIVLVHTMGDCHLNNHLFIRNVLLVPNFKFNLISVAQLVNGFDCDLQFNDKECLIQDREKMNLLATVRADQGLYKLVQEKSSSILSVQNNNDVILAWHR